MTESRWTRIEELFNDVVELPPPEQRRALEAACVDDTELRAAVEKLLRAHGQDVSRVRKVVDHAIGADPVANARAGENLGSYTLVRSLGEGGMGSVYLAQRSDDVHAAEVAVKILKGPAVEGDRARRFRAERHILADLNHPGIARLLDGGTTVDGAPYLVMEYVDGQPIDDYCVAKELSTRATVELFRAVCDAVQFAHGRLVVHRDLKPANILVTAGNTPKLLDFGIAKLIDQDLDADVTQTGFRPMTPNYASPEQVRGDAITTSTDVYALGVLLYELLTGVLPYPGGAQAARALEDAILGHAPTAPSVAVTQETPRRTATDGGRNTTARGLRGDLDTIVLKALQKDPARRYASVEQLSEDLGRHLVGLPVRARPDTLTYRAGKFVQRNRGSVLSGTLAFLVISLLAGSSALQSVQLKKERDALALERDKAAAVSDFMIGVFRSSDPNEARGVDITAREILANGGRRVREDLANDPAVQAAVMGAIGEVYERLAVYDSAEVLLSAAVDQTRLHYGDTSVEFASALLDLSEVQQSQDRFDEARDAILKAREIFTSILGPDDVRTAEAWNNLGSLHKNLNQFESAEEAHLEALRIRSAALGDDHAVTTVSLNNLMTGYIDVGRFDEAIAMGQRNLAARRTLYGTNHPEVATALNNLANALEMAGRYEDALPIYHESQEVRHTLYPDGHPSILTAANNLGTLYSRLGRNEEARELFIEVAAGQRALGNRSLLGRTLANLGTITARTGRYAEAQRHLREAIDLLSEILGADNPAVAVPLRGLAEAQVGEGDAKGAEQSLREAIRIQRAALSASDPNLSMSVHMLSRLLIDEERFDEAEPVAQEALDIATEALDPAHPLSIKYAIAMAKVRLAQGSLEEARRLLEQAEATALAARGSEDRDAAAARELLDTHWSGAR